MALPGGGGEDGSGDITRTRLPCSEEVNQVLPAIFAFLNLRERASAMQVCRAWRAAGKDPLLFRQLDLRTHRLSTGAVAFLSSCCGALESLRLGGRDNALLACRLRASTLRCLTVDSLEPKSSCAVSALGAAFSSLTALHVVHSHKMTASSLNALSVTLPLLTELHLDDTLRLPASAVDALPAFGQLASLSLRYCALDPAGLDLCGCASLTSLSLAGALDAEDAERPLRLAAALPAGLQRLDVSLARVVPSELDAWLAAAPGRTLTAFAAVDGVRLGPYPPPRPAGRRGGGGGGGEATLQLYGDDELLAAAQATGPAARWLHAAAAHATWAFLSLREAVEGEAPPPPPGPLEPWLRTPSAQLVRAGVLLTASAHADVRECAAGMLSSLANVQEHLDAMLRHGGWAALLRLAASPRSELVQELAAEGLRNLSYQSARIADLEEEEERQPQPLGSRLLLLSPAALASLVLSWRAGTPRVRRFAALTLSDIARMVVHFSPDGCAEQVAAMAALLAADPVPAFVELSTSADVGDQYAGARPLAVMSFLGRAGLESSVFGNHPQAKLAIGDMVRCGAVPPLVALLAPGHDADIRAEAAGVVRNCCFADAAAAAAVTAAGGVAALAELAGSDDAEDVTTGAAESALTALCNLACVTAATAAAVAASEAPAVLARAAREPGSRAAAGRWVATVALCGLEAHGAVPRAAAAASTAADAAAAAAATPGGRRRRGSGSSAAASPPPGATPGPGSPGAAAEEEAPFAALARLLRGVRPDGAWLPDERKGLVVQVLLQLPFCTHDEACHVASCRGLARLATDAAAARLVQQEGGREVLRRLCAAPARSVRLEAERAAAALRLALGNTPRASARLRVRAPLDT